MITNFSEQTQELNDYELKSLLPIIIQGLKTKIGKDKAVTNKHICKALKNFGHKLTDSRLRKIIHHIRANDLVPLLIATSKGYYVSNNDEEIQDYIKSLQERANSILFIKNCLQKQLSEKNNNQMKFNI